jgi:DNA-binding XRE family transcriptional regulator
VPNHALTNIRQACPSPDPQHESAPRDRNAYGRQPQVGTLARALSLRDLIEKTRPVRLPESTELRDLRLSAGFSQEETALAIGVSLRTVAAWEAGENEPRRAAGRRYGSALAVFARLGSRRGA